jgi:ribosomal protein L18E
MSAGFWTSAEVSPKRKFRFLLTVGNMPNGATFYTKSVTKPQVTVATANHKFLNHTFKYPGSVTWNDVTATLVDPVSPDASINLSRILRESGYKPPADVNDTTTISKKNAVAALGTVVITQIDATDVPVETWTLHNAWISDIQYGSDLSYGTDELTDLTVKFTYDWASIDTNGRAAEAGPVLGDGNSRYFVPGQSN